MSSDQKATIPPAIRRLRRQRVIETVVQIVAVLLFIGFLVVRAARTMP